MDSSESPVHGQQEGVAYNGHFESVCYHPLFLFNHFGDCEGAMLRPGNVHSAERWREVLEPVVKRYQEKGVRLLFRADAAFAKPEVYEYLESRDTGYAMRLPANEVLQRNIRHLLKRPVGRPPKKPVVRVSRLRLPGPELGHSPACGRQGACPELAEGWSGTRVSYSRGSGSSSPTSTYRRQA